MLTVQVAILNESNQLLPTGEIGEVCIRGDNVTKGYINNPKANEEAYAGGVLLPLYLVAPTAFSVAYFDVKA